MQTHTAWMSRTGETPREPDAKCACRVVPCRALDIGNANIHGEESGRGCPRRRRGAGRQHKKLTMFDFLVWVLVTQGCSL